MLITFSGTVIAKDAPIAYIAIIIDDLGYKPYSDNKALNLEGDYSYAFLPFAPHSRKLADLAKAKNRDILLHLPMQSLNPVSLGPGGLTMNMNHEDFIDTISQSLLSLPNVSGINNHMGSLLTSSDQHMKWLMSFLAEKKLFLTYASFRTIFGSKQINAPSEFIIEINEELIESERREDFFDSDSDEGELLPEVEKGDVIKTIYLE